MAEEKTVKTGETVEQERTSTNILNLLYRKVWIIILAAVLCALIALGFNLAFVKPVYTASETVLLVTNVSNSSGNYDPKTDASLAQLYLPETAQLIKSSYYIEKANEKYALAHPEADKNAIKASGVKVTYGEEIMIFTISYSDTTKKGAIEKLKAVVASAQENLCKDEIGVHATEVALKTTQHPDTENVAVSNSKMMYLVLGALLGIIGSVAIILFVNAIDNTVKTKEEAEELTGASVVAFIDKF